MSVGYGRIRFQTDEDFNSEIEAGLRRKRPGIDVLTAKDAGLLHAPDPDVLAYAAEHGRILLSHDMATMPVHFDTFIVSGRESPGLMLVAQEMPVGRAIDAITFVWELSGPDDWHNLRISCPYNSVLRPPAPLPERLARPPAERGGLRRLPRHILLPDAAPANLPGAIARQEDTPP